ncbi:hypothetical protein [actinidia virus B]|uniref:Uncharacterized protein n=1 Tax=actinidia virus B TaxID=3240218 RepID=G8H9D5_9VIRU|nr:ORF2 gene product [Actinidia virus B]AET36891.1 hypothetical protein [Actinidia virus B]
MERSLSSELETKGVSKAQQKQKIELEVLSFLRGDEAVRVPRTPENEESILHLVRLARSRGFINLKHFDKIRASTEPSRLKYAAKHIELVALRLGHNISDLIAEYSRPTPLSYIIGPPPGPIKEILTVPEFFKYLTEHLSEPPEEEYEIERKVYDRVDISFPGNLLCVYTRDINNQTTEQLLERKQGIEKVLNEFNLSRLLVYDLFINSAACDRKEHQNIRRTKGGGWEIRR